MLSPADDYPLHQTPEPIAYAGSDRNFYDRFFFNGYSAAGDAFFALALGVYPQLDVMDASFSLSLGGRQYNLRASKEMGGDRLNTSVGPICVDIVRPMQEIRIRIGDNEGGLTADLVAQARHKPIEEPRFTRRQGTRLTMDLTRATQNVAWSGTVGIGGETLAVDGYLGTRDRSWGIRQVGAADPQPMVPPSPPQFYWVWTPSNLENAAFFCHSNDDAQGMPWNRRAVLDDFATGQRLEMDRVEMAASYRAGTRRIGALEVSAGDVRAAFTTLERTFYMQGLGYIHPEWNHGTHQGALRVAFEEMDLAEAEAELAAGRMENLHIQALAEVRLETPAGAYGGMGVIEQLFIGAHAPSGFEGLLDPVVR